MLPFVRGVDLSGNDFKVSSSSGGGGPGSRLGSLFRSSPHQSSASCPARLRAQCSSGQRAGSGGDHPGLGFPVPNGSPRPPL